MVTNEVEESIILPLAHVGTGIVVHCCVIHIPQVKGKLGDCDVFSENSEHHWTWQLAAASVERSLKHKYHQSSRHTLATSQVQVDLVD